jgi:hypothetical protein
MLMTHHPTEETLAAYVDNQLDSTTRAAVTEHLASCGECRGIVLMATDYQAEEEQAKVAHGAFGRRGWMAAVAGLATAAVVTVVVVRQRPWLPDLEDVKVAAKYQQFRASDGRLAGGFDWAQPQGTSRGGASDSPDTSTVSNDARMLQIAADLEDAKSADSHLVGITRLSCAQTFDGKEKREMIMSAVELLEKAYDGADPSQRDSFAIDFSAGLLERARWSANPEADNVRALELANQVLSRHQNSPEALWNRAFALENLNRENEAVNAWNDYLKVDGNSKWADEAKEHIRNLREFI